MGLHPPNLDDRTYDDLVGEAEKRIRHACPEWTDLTPGDPGRVLLETFSYITDIMLYRLNRLPQKAFVEFLRLIGVKLQPPTAARTTLSFTVSRPSDRPLEIPRATRVTVSRTAGKGELPVFLTARAGFLQPGKTALELPALHLEHHPGELAGKGTGLPGLSVAVQNPPIVAPTGEDLDLVVAVEATAEELAGRANAVKFEGKDYRIWREVESFAELRSDPEQDRHVYLVDRLTGRITFAPSVSLRGDAGTLADAPVALAEVPATDREIRVWYSTGGGPDGNLAAGTLTVFRDPIPGVQVANPARATGGRAAETLENALLRGPQELHSLKRAVTARDFELLAKRDQGSVNRARAFTKAQLWKHARPGTVEVLLVPTVPGGKDGDLAVTGALLTDHQTAEAKERIQAALDERRPLGTTCQANWVRYKTVRAEAHVVVHPEEDPKAVEGRVRRRLNQIINPLTTDLRPTGWPFGEPLRAFHVYETVRAEPGVSYVENVSFHVDEVPDANVSSIEADRFQEKTWYAAAGETLFRSLNDGAGWEPAGRFPGEETVSVRVHPGHPGLLAVATSLPSDRGNGSGLYASWDCGETWKPLAETSFRVEDVAWVRREGIPVLLLATENGLYELALRPGTSPTPVQIVVDPSDMSKGFYAVVASTDVRGQVSVAVAAKSGGGIYLSSEGGLPDTFRPIGLTGEDIRRLQVEYDGPRSFLWAGAMASGRNDPGKGCFRWELMGSRDPADGWKGLARNWKGGSCLGIAFLGSKVLAATHHAGVVWRSRTDDEAEWEECDFVGSNLPVRDKEWLEVVDSVATNAEGGLIMAAGPKGVHASRDKGVTYRSLSERRHETVTLPSTWLFCSGDHSISVTRQDEKR